MLLQQECAFEAIQLWLVPAFSRFVYKCQRFCEHCQSCLWLSHGSVYFGEKRQKIGLIYHCSRGTKGSQALGELLDPFLGLSCLLRQSPATHERTSRYPLRKSLFRGKSDRRCSAFLDSTPLTTELMEQGRMTQDETQTQGVRHLLR